MPYEIMKAPKLRGEVIPVPFIPPLRIDRIEVLRLVAPIVDREFGPVVVMLDGELVEWREGKGAGAA
jgi:hypothetical protein